MVHPPPAPSGVVLDAMGVKYNVLHIFVNYSFLFVWVGFSLIFLCSIILFAVCLFACPCLKIVIFDVDTLEEQTKFNCIDQ